MKIEWEYDLVEKPFCEQLRVMGWKATLTSLNSLSVRPSERFCSRAGLLRRCESLICAQGGPKDSTHPHH